MFYEPADAVTFATGAQLRKPWTTCGSFSSTRAFRPERAKVTDFVGISFADGSMLGDPNNVKLRFNADYMKLAAEGKL